MTRLASLPMYAWPETARHHARFWAVLRDALHAEGVDAPPVLASPDTPHTHWRDPSLLLSQTCGWPWASAFQDDLALVATPHYAVEGCGPGVYSSAVIVPATSSAQTLTDLRGSRVAFNGLDSQSGVHTLRAKVAPLTDGTPFFGQGIMTGAHRASVAAIATGQADCAAIDAVCWALGQRHDPYHTGRVRVLAWTDPAPALPFVTTTRARRDIPAIRRALKAAIGTGAGSPLFIADIDPPDEAAYLDLIDRVRGTPPLAPDTAAHV